VADHAGLSLIASGCDEIQPAGLPKPAGLFFATLSIRRYVVPSALRRATKRK
jgi:hypothetical protein